MTGTLGPLALAAFAFLAAHFALSAAPVRRLLVGAIGEWPFRIAYSVVAIALFAWMMWAFGAAPRVQLWHSPVALKHLSLTIMPIAWILLVCSYTQRNPTAVGQDRPGALHAHGILKVTRHPAMWAIALWALAHLLASGAAGPSIVFLAMGALALGGAWHSDRRRAAIDGPEWTAFARETSFVPLAALLGGRTRMKLAEIGWWRIALGLVIHGVVLYLHGRLFGVAPLASFAA